MDDLAETYTKIKQFSASFQPDIKEIIEMISENKLSMYIDFKCAKFYQAIMSANHLLCKTKCKIMQIRYDLYEMKKRRYKQSEFNKTISLLRRYEEFVEVNQKKLLKELKSAQEIGNKKNFTDDKMEKWKEVALFMDQLMGRIDM